MVSVESLAIVVGLVFSAILLASVWWLTRNRTPSAPSSAVTPDTADGTDTSAGQQRSDDSSSDTARDTPTAGDGDTESVQHSQRSDSVDGSSDPQADGDTATQVYDPDIGNRAGTQVWLHIEGYRIEIPTGVAVGRELRHHLVNQSVAKQRALAISRDDFIVESVETT